ncbi:MAG: MFS transporter [Gammaproteobacteria bacterium]|nr:MFS transporter [Gammaproteobacteria bacterium]NNC56671.1 MFS transporter [Woeseiaceae bacterium]
MSSSSALGSRNFLIYLVGSTISLHGLWIYRVALGWFAWQLTASEFWVGVVAFTQFAPAVFFGPLFGVLADRVDRRKASIVINASSSANMLVLATLAALGQVNIGVLTAFSLVQGALDGAHTPVRMTLVPNLVARQQLESAIASTSISFNVSRFVGPAIAGIVIATLGVSAAFALNGLSYLAIVTAVVFVELRPRTRRGTKPSAVWSELLDGVRYVRDHKMIRGLLIMIAVGSVFGRGAMEMLPAFADAVFSRGSSGLAILTSAVGVGAVATGVVLARTTLWLNIVVIRMSVVLAGLLIAALGANDAFWVAVSIVTMLGVILSLGGVGSQILMQSLVDEDVRGRVSSLWGMIAFGGVAFGGLAVGIAASAFGLQLTVIVTGLLCSAAALIPRYGTAQDIGE